MRSCQKELERVEAQLEKRGMEMSELQSRLQDADKILVSAVSLLLILDFNGNIAV